MDGFERVVVRCSDEGVLLLRRPGWSSTHVWARPNVDGANPGVVEGRLGSVAPSRWSV
jgi:hypothetical protein